MMTCFYKCLLSLLLVAMTATKVAIPVTSWYKLSAQSGIDPEEQKTSEETNTEKTDAEKVTTEVAEFTLIHHSAPVYSKISSFYQSYFVSLLPSRYCAVPTPPPWRAC